MSYAVSKSRSVPTALALSVALLAIACGSSSNEPRASAIAVAPTAQFGIEIDPWSGEPMAPDDVFQPDSEAPELNPQPGAGGTPFLDAIAQPGIQVKLEPWFVTDPMADGIVAMTWLAPDGWSGVGEVQWLPEWSRGAHLATRVSDPNTGLTVEWLPSQDFIWFEPLAGLPPPPIGGNYQGNAYVPPPTDALQFVADMWMGGPLAHLQGANVTSITEVPAVANEFVHQFGGPASANAFRIRYEYFNDAGELWQEDVSFAWLFAANTPPLLWYVNFAYSVRAPAGLLDTYAGVTSTVVASRTSTPEWEGVYRLVQQLFLQGQQQQLANENAFGQALAQNREEARALQEQVSAERQQSQDRIATLRGETLQGIDNFTNPFTQTIVQMPQTWQTYWVNDKGEYILSDQGNFDPNSFPELGFWQRLQPR